LIQVNTMDRSKLNNMSEYLKTRIFGQNHVIDQVCDLVAISAAGLGEENRPIASFLFSGPTGVGKTELAIEIAKYLDMDFIRFDMSEYANESSYRNLIGGDKGLVGHEEGGLLTNAIVRNPQSVLLLDEIEKADKTVYNTFLQVFDHASLTDTKGNEVDFSQTIIIMTSNLGAKEEKGIGFGSNITFSKDDAVAEFFSPEFRNRIDKVIHFLPLNDTTALSIVKKYLNDLEIRLAIMDVYLHITGSVIEHLVQIGFDREMGARSVKRIIQTEIKKRLAQEMLFGELKEGGGVEIDYLESEHKFVYTYTSLMKLDEELAEMYGVNTTTSYDFLTANEAQAFAKAHPGTVIVRSEDGQGFVIKRNNKDLKVDILT